MSAQNLKDCISYLIEYHLLHVDIHPLSDLNKTLSDFDKQIFKMVLRGFPLFLWQKCFGGASLLSNTHISVGSGDGVIEKIFSFTRPDCEMICVDPFPQCFTSASDRIFYPPAFPYVQDLVKEKPEVVGQANLMLIFPEPGCFFCAHGNCTEKIHTQPYDFEAISALKPRSIITMICMNGSSGTDHLRFWMLTNTTYELIYTCQSYLLPDIEIGQKYAVIPQLMFWVRKDLCGFPNLKAGFLDLPKSFYSKADYDRVLATLPIHEQNYSEEELKRLGLMVDQVAATKANHFKSISPRPTFSSSSEISQQDQGFFFKFE